jgi:(p)ppGpp synthase/HD superfamily hydrolase
MPPFPSPVPGDHALILHAVRVATVAHHGQMRKYTGDPYIVHPLSVAQMVAHRTMDPHVIAAAVLHDVIEDTSVTYHHLLSLFGERVAELVNELTDRYTHEAYPQFNRAQRKQMERDRLATVSQDAQLIKGCDMLDNMWSIQTHDPGFYSVFMKEKQLLLEVLTGLDPHVRLQLENRLS